MTYLSRRAAVKSSIFGFLAVSIPQVSFAREMIGISTGAEVNELFYRYPAISDEVVSEVVGKSHFDLDRVKELVNHRPELSRATWDWGFGDWETAVGAASHVGRRDIVEFLLSKGARPNIFTYAILGQYQAVKAMIEARPGIQSTPGPHGISLLAHAEAGLRQSDSMTQAQIDNCKQLIEYLESLEGADIRPEHKEMSAEEKEMFLGDYMYGEGSEDGFSIKLNMRDLLSMGRIGKFGGALYHKGNYVFSYNGAPSIEISFLTKANTVHSLTIKEPDLTLTALKT